MATYLGNAQDSIEQFQPYNPNLAFNVQVLSAKQSAYDAGHAKLNNLYGSLLNSSMSREENITARDEFFKSIDSDIKKMTRLDLSKENNVSLASTVFKPITENEHIVKDISWTRNFQDELSRAEAYKNCNDPEKCGGQYWEQGERYLHYKRNEFASANQQDALNFENVSFVPYSNVMAKAMKAAKEANLSITKDTISGNYKVTTKNGEALVSPLTSLFSNLFENDPNIQKQFEVEAYLERKDWITDAHRSGKYASEQEAEVGYVTEKANLLNDRLESMHIDVDSDHDRLTTEYNDLMEKVNNNEVSEGSDDHKRLMELQQIIPAVNQAKAYTEASRNAIKNTYNTRNLRAIGSQLDTARAATLLDDEIGKSAQVLAYKDAEQKLEADD
jgi:hypothetical protein